MKTKRHEYKQGWSRMVSALLALALAVGLVLAAPSLDGMALATGDTAAPGTSEGEPAEPAEAGEDAGATPRGGTPLGGEAQPGQLKEWCRLTVKFPDPKQVQNPPADAVRVDVYKIADAVMIPGYNTYEFSIPKDSEYSLYQNVIEAFIGKDNPDWRMSTAADGSFRFRYAPAGQTDGTASDWSALVEKIAEACFEKETEPVAKDAQIDDGKPIPLNPGLYLVVVRGSKVPPAYVGDAAADYGKYNGYVIKRDIKGADGKVTGQGYRTIAYDDETLYIFQPQLIALPGFGENGTFDGNVNDSSSTAGPGDWQYDVTIVTKHEHEQRYADLKIVKSLPVYAAPATFVFRVTAVNPDDHSQKYEWVRALEFSGPGSKETEVNVDHIPAGWKVTVTEEYSGSVYTSGGVQLEYTKNDGFNGEVPESVTVEGGTITIDSIPAGSFRLTAPDGKEVRLPDGTTEVITFTNDYDRRNNGGGAVINRFDPDDTSNGWHWTKRSYKDGAWVVEKQDSTGANFLPIEREKDTAGN